MPSDGPKGKVWKSVTICAQQSRLANTQSLAPISAAFYGRGKNVELTNIADISAEYLPFSRKSSVSIKKNVPV